MTSVREEKHRSQERSKRKAAAARRRLWRAAIRITKRFEALNGSLLALSRGLKGAR